jgi:hypothetical protein
VRSPPGGAGDIGVEETGRDVGLAAAGPEEIGPGTGDCAPPGPPVGGVKRSRPETGREAGDTGRDAGETGRAEDSPVGLPVNGMPPGLPEVGTTGGWPDIGTPGALPGRGTPAGLPDVGTAGE